MDVLNRIRRAAWRGALRFTLKAREEMRSDELSTEDVRESLVFATRIAKVIRSRTGPNRKGGDKLYVIKSQSLTGTTIYTKGTFRKDEDEAEVFYILVSAKHSTA